MAENKRALEIELLKLDISGFTTTGESRHVATCELVWPRMQVASKSSVRTLKLHKGVVELQKARWLDRILFKESVEYRFGLVFRVTQSLSAELFDELMRFIGATAFGIAGNMLDKEIGNEAGDLAASPLLFIRKKLQASHEAEIILEGGIDMNAADLEEDAIVEIPLISQVNRYTHTMNTSGRGPSSSRKRIIAVGSRLGTATLHISSLR